jgi:hypothetical protein
MPAKSRKQYRFMKAVESGNIQVPGLSPEEASEYTEGQQYEDLPKKMADGGVMNTGDSLKATRKQSYAKEVKKPFSKLIRKLKGKK